MRKARCSALRGAGFAASARGALSQHTSPEVFKIVTITTIVSRFNPTTGSRFETKAERSYIIMELRDATVFTKCSQYPPADCYDLIAEGIQLLRRMPVPEGTTPGPCTKDPTQRPKMKHPLFKEDQAEMVYRDIDELQDHINRVWITIPP
jgi:hypothetical protein